MNVPPDRFVRVSYDQMRHFVASVGRAAGLPEDKADFLSELLTVNDLRGVFSHGTVQIASYAQLMREGKINPRPQVSIVSETPISLIVDGDGGLGYFPAYQGTQLAIEKAQKTGVAILLTRNHGHLGAAGIYARLTLPYGLATFVTSGHQLRLSPGDPVHNAAGGSPMAFSAPTGDEDPVVLDFGTMHDLYSGDPYRDMLARTVPGMVLRHIGMGAICQSWGGLLAGLSVNPANAHPRFPGAYQGSLLITFAVSLFTSAERFRKEMDEYVSAVRSLEPLPGFDLSLLPGGIEARRERDYRRKGIPVGEEHRKRLEEIARETGVPVPWGR